MLRYKTKTRPGSVALYDIRPGNGAGPFLQPRSPHGATKWTGVTKRINVTQSEKMWHNVHVSRRVQRGHQCHRRHCQWLSLSTATNSSPPADLHTQHTHITHTIYITTWVLWQSWLGDRNGIRPVNCWMLVVIIWKQQLKHFVHKLSKSQKVDLRKSPLELWTCKRLKFN